MQIGHKTKQLHKDLCTKIYPETVIIAIIMNSQPSLPENLLLILLFLFFSFLMVLGF
jgi:hypothetical protein